MPELNQDIINAFVFKLKKQLYVGIIEGLKLVYNDDECPFIYLELIKIRKKYRNQGIGTQVMSDIINFANVHNIEIHLYAVDIYGSDLKRLHKFYRNLGFVLIKNNKDGKFVYRPRKKPENVVTNPDIIRIIA
jgi:GNAT superfamily N-acetyltransferase